MKVRELSVFFPCINEEGNITNAVSKAIVVLEQLNVRYEVIVVNDGSTDRTGEIADELASKNPKIRVIHHVKNLGYGAALQSGFYSAKYDTIVYTDGDGQFDFNEVTKFIDKLDDADLVIGYRIKRRDPFFRILFGKGWSLTLWTFFGLTLKDVDCGFKMIKKEVLQKIPRLQSQRGAMINAELAIKTKKAGFRVTQVGVNHYPRLSGRPTGANLQVIVKSYIDLLSLWWKLKDEKTLFFTLLAIILLATFLRFYKLDQYMTFLGDEGRDALIIKKLLVDYDLPFIGPTTSIGNIYLGPLYYYMMAIPMAIFWLNPVAAAGMNALVGVLTVVLIYYLGKVWFNRTAGLISAFLYAISPVTIIYSRSSWNPNPTPFFALLGILGFYKAHQSLDFRWLVLTGAAVAFALQMHYLALILLPLFGLLWLYELYRKLKWFPRTRFFWSGSLLALTTLLLLMSPLALFDLKHDFLNFRAFTTILSDRSAIEPKLFNDLTSATSIYTHNLIGRYLTGGSLILTNIVALAVAALLVWVCLRRFQGRRVAWQYGALGLWLGLGLVGLSFYQHTIYDHYLGFLNPVPFLLLGAAATFRFSSTKVEGMIRGVLIVLLVTGLAFINLQKNPLHLPPNRQLDRTQRIAEFIVSETNGKPLNFALIAQNNYDAAYQFYLDIYGYKPKQVPFEITDQLFVVCEDPVCQPINHPKQEISHFGWAKIEEEKEFAGVKVFKLIPNPGGKP